MQRPSNDDPDRLTPAEVNAELHHLCGNADYARAKSLARVMAVGIAAYTAEDLLHDTMVSLLSGERRWPRGVHTLVVLKTAMHSIASNARKNSNNTKIDRQADAEAVTDDHDDCPVSAGVTDVTPVDIANTKSELEMIQNLVSGDEEAELVVMAWADDLRGKDAAAELGFDMNTYEAARKRLLRKLVPVTNAREKS